MAREAPEEIIQFNRSQEELERQADAAGDSVWPGGRRSDSGAAAGDAPTAIDTQTPVTGSAIRYVREDVELGLALVGDPIDAAPETEATLEFTSDGASPETREGLQVKLGAGLTASSTGITTANVGVGTDNAFMIFDGNGGPPKDADAPMIALEDIQLSAGKDILPTASSDYGSLATPGGAAYVGSSFVTGATGDSLSISFFLRNIIAGGFGGAVRWFHRRSDGAQDIKEAAQIRAEGISAWNSDPTTDDRLVFRVIQSNALTDYMILDGGGETVDLLKAVEASSTVEAAGGFIDNGNAGVDGTDATGSTISGGLVTAIGALSAMPAGAIVAWGGSSPPTGWLDCDASAVSRATFGDLFGEIGTTYGVGDGSTTFNLPAGAGKFLRGNTPGTGGGADTHTTTITGSTAAISVAFTTTIVRADQADIAVVDDLPGTHSHGNGTLAGSSASNIPAYTGVTWIIKT